MELYHNVHKHTKGKYKGRADDEYYFIKEKKVLCIYVPRDEDEIEVRISYWNSSWNFGFEKFKISDIKEVLVRTVFDKNFEREMYDDYIKGAE